MGWLKDEIDNAAQRRFRRAILQARTEFNNLPPERQETLAREFQEAADAALRHARYHRKG